MLAAIGSAVGSAYAYRIAQQTNQTATHANAIATESAKVAKLAQDFTERLYKEQLALNAPALSITGGHIDAVASVDLLSRPVYVYTITFTLRNSGGRDARTVYVALDQATVPQTYQVKLDSLPKDTDVQIRVSLEQSAQQSADWNVAVAYGDDLPTHTLTNMPTTAPAAATTRVCAPALAVSLASLPGIHKTLQDNQWVDLRFLSAGAPASAAEYVRRKVLAMQTDDRACVRI